MGTGAVVSFAVPVLRFASTVSNRRDQSEGHQEGPPRTEGVVPLPREAS